MVFVDVFGINERYSEIFTNFFRRGSIVCELWGLELMLLEGGDFDLENSKHGLS